MDKARLFLQRSGWTDHEIDAYLVLIQHGPQTRSDLNSYLTKNVSSATMGTTIKRLEGHGAIVGAKSGQQNASPRYEPPAPDAVFSRLLEDAHDLGRAAMDELGPLHDKAMKQAPLLDGWAVHTDTGCRRVLQTHIEGATKRVLVLDRHPAWLKPKQLKSIAAKKDGLHIMIVVGPESSVVSPLTAMKLPFSTRENLAMRVCIVDDRVLLLSGDGRGFQSTTDDGIVNHFSDTVAAAFEEASNGT